MLQAILCYKFHIGSVKSGEIEPEFIPIKLIFNNEQYSQDDYSGLISSKDVFGIFYQHTTGVFISKGAFNNYFVGRLKETPFQVISCFRQEIDRSQFMTLSIFELSDDVEIFEDIIKKMASKLEPFFQEYLKLGNKAIGRAKEKLEENFAKELNFGVFQVERLSNLDKLQKLALIFQSEERTKILEILRERPVSKKQLRDKLERTHSNVNVDLLLEPFLELNLVRRDWIKGTRDKKTGQISHQGEYFFLVKDVILTRLPNKKIIGSLKNTTEYVYMKYESKLKEYFTSYDPNQQENEDIGALASMLLIPDCFDLYSLMKEKFYKKKKVPKMFSDFVEVDIILKIMEEVGVIITLKDDEDEEWIILFSEIVPIVLFPEYSLPKIIQAYKSDDIETSISYEIARKAIDLMEVTYYEKLAF